MGITGLLPLLRPVTQDAHIRDLRGKVVAVDTYCWLHRAVYCCAVELCQGKDTDKYIHWCLERVRLLLHYGVKPYLVFDGAPLPAKKGTETERKKKRQENMLKGFQLLRENNATAAYAYLAKAADVTPFMAYRLMQAVKTISGVKFVVAPYEADAQLGYLSRNGLVDAVITEDSDIILFGCTRVLFKMDREGACQEVRLNDVMTRRNDELDLRGYSVDYLLNTCTLSGCDYLPSVTGIGLKKALKLVKRHKGDVTKMLRAIRFEYGERAAGKEYEVGLLQALLTFRHQRVFDPVTRKLVHLTDLPALPAKTSPISSSASSLTSSCVAEPWTLWLQSLETEKEKTTGGGDCSDGGSAEVTKGTAEHVGRADGPTVSSDSVEVGRLLLPLPLPLDFLGPPVNRQILCGIADGELDPVTHQPFHDMKPSSTSTSTSTSTFSSNAVPVTPTPKHFNATSSSNGYAYKKKQLSGFNPPPAPTPQTKPITSYFLKQASPSPPSASSSSTSSSSRVASPMSSTPSTPVSNLTHLQHRQVQRGRKARTPSLDGSSNNGHSGGDASRGSSRSSKSLSSGGGGGGSIGSSGAVWDEAEREGNDGGDVNGSNGDNMFGDFYNVKENPPLLVIIPRSNTAVAPSIPTAEDGSADDVADENHLGAAGGGSGGGLSLSPSTYSSFMYEAPCTPKEKGEDYREIDDGGGGGGGGDDDDEGSDSGDSFQVSCVGKENGPSQSQSDCSSIGSPGSNDDVTISTALAGSGGGDGAHLNGSGAAAGGVSSSKHFCCRGGGSSAKLGRGHKKKLSASSKKGSSSSDVSNISRRSCSTPILELSKRKKTTMMMMTTTTTTTTTTTQVSRKRARTLGVRTPWKAETFLKSSMTFSKNGLGNADCKSEENIDQSDLGAGSGGGGGGDIQRCDGNDVCVGDGVMQQDILSKEDDKVVVVQEKQCSRKRTKGTGMLGASTCAPLPSTATSTSSSTLRSNNSIKSLVDRDLFSIFGYQKVANAAAVMEETAAAKRIEVEVDALAADHVFNDDSGDGDLDQGARSSNTTCHDRDYGVSGSGSFSDISNGDDSEVNSDWERAGGWDERTQEASPTFCEPAPPSSLSSSASSSLYPPQQRSPLLPSSPSSSSLASTSMMSLSPSRKGNHCYTTNKHCTAGDKEDKEDDTRCSSASNKKRGNLIRASTTTPTPASWRTDALSSLTSTSTASCSPTRRGEQKKTIAPSSSSSSTACAAAELMESAGEGYEHIFQQFCYNT